MRLRRERRRRAHVDEVQHVRVLQRAQQSDLAQQPLAVGAVVERVEDFLHCHHALRRRRVGRRAARRRRDERADSIRANGAARC